LFIGSPLLFLAALVTYRARRFTGRLAGSLAFAATPGHRCFGEWRIIYRLNVFSHLIFPSPIVHHIYFIFFCHDRQ
jgi:hypothetical protein